MVKEKPPENNSCTECFYNFDIIQILKRSVKVKLVIAYFEKNKKLILDTQQKISETIVENLLIDNLNKKITAAYLAKLAEYTEQNFPSENRETYFSIEKGKINKV